MSKPVIVCLTPVKNEDWILERFLRCASLWADRIIVADQGSTDNSLEICTKFEKVSVINNPGKQYDEGFRQTLLIQEARKIPGKRLLITLDADEMLTSNFLHSPEWRTVTNAEPGTVVCFKWVNIHPDFRRGWEPGYPFPWGFMDDGSKHTGKDMHSTRIPLPKNAPRLFLNDIRVLHYQYTDWDRMESKHRWYQVQEQLLHPDRSIIEVYRQYHHMYNVTPEQYFPLQNEWFEAYEKNGIEMRSITKSENYWYDSEMMSWFERHGCRKYEKLPIWDVDWNRIAKQAGKTSSFKDPRGPISRLVHWWLKKTQPYYTRFRVRKIDDLLKKLGW